MSERIYSGSPAQEFYDLAKLYVKLFGTMTATVDVWRADLGRLRIYTAPDRNWLLVKYLQPCETGLYAPISGYELVWSNSTGFQVEDWYQHLEAFRKALILERLADIK